MVANVRIVCESSVLEAAFSSIIAYYIYGLSNKNATDTVIQQQR